MKKRERHDYVVRFTATVSNAPWGRDEEGERCRIFEQDVLTVDFESHVCVFEFNQRDAITRARYVLKKSDATWFKNEFVRWRLTGLRRLEH